LTGVGIKAGTAGKLKAQNDAVMALIGNKDTTSRASFGNTSASGMMRGSTPKKLAPIKDDQKDMMNESFTSLNSNNSKADRIFKAGM